MPTHPLWRPYAVLTAEEIAAARVSPARSGPCQRIAVSAPDPRWNEWVLELCATVRAALGPRVIDLGHVGSTAVPGLWAKPVIDLDLVVEDSSAEPACSLADEQPLDTVADYNNRKAALIYEIYERIFAADPEHAHDPRPIGAAIA